VCGYDLTAPGRSGPSQRCPHEQSPVGKTFRLNPCAWLGENRARRVRVVCAAGGVAVGSSSVSQSVRMTSSARSPWTLYVCAAVLAAGGVSGADLAADTAADRGAGSGAAVGASGKRELSIEEQKAVLGLLYAAFWSFKALAIAIVICILGINGACCLCPRSEQRRLRETLEASQNPSPLREPRICSAAAHPAAPRQ
jgi:hypothetical protein